MLTGEALGDLGCMKRIKCLAFGPACSLLTRERWQSKLGSSHCSVGYPCKVGDVGDERTLLSSTEHGTIVDAVDLMKCSMRPHFDFRVMSILAIHEPRV